MNDKKKDKDLDRIRERAEKMLNRGFTGHYPLGNKDPDELIEELNSHQIILELQNEELRKAQTELSISHQRFRELYDFAPVGYFSLDRYGRIEDVNNTGIQMLGIFRSQLINRDMSAFIFGQDRDRFDRFISDLYTEGKAHSCDIRLSVSRDQFLFARINGGVLPDKAGQTQLFVTLTDVTEQKQAEAELERMKDELGDRVKLRTAELSETVKALEKEIEERKKIANQLRISQEKLRQLSHKTMAIMENDRKNVAREIHDSLGGSLAAIKYRLEDSLNKNSNNEEIGEALLKTIEYIQETIKETKRISAGLRPTTLDDLGLKPTIKWFCRHLMEFHPEINIVTRIDLNEDRIEESLKIVIYRIVQEAITNAAQHSGADTVWLTISHEENAVVLDIRDNGCGFDKEKVFSEKLEALSGYGLVSIRERTEICGGTFTIESFTDAGTNVKVVLPENSIS